MKSSFLWFNYFWWNFWSNRWPLTPHNRAWRVTSSGIIEINSWFLNLFLLGPIWFDFMPVLSQFGSLNFGPHWLTLCFLSLSLDLPHWSILPIPPLTIFVHSGSSKVAPHPLGQRFANDTTQRTITTAIQSPPCSIIDTIWPL